MANRVAAGHNIGELLLREGLITNAQLDLALNRQRQTDMPLIRILVSAGILDETKRLNFFKHQFSVPIVSLGSAKIEPLLYTYIPGVLARKHHVVPVRLDRDGLVVAMEDPSDLLLLDNLKEIVGLRIKPVVAPTEEIAAALEGYPEEQPEVIAAPVAEKFDPVARLLKYAFLPLMSGGVLLAMFASILLYSPARHLYDSFVGQSSNAKFNLFIYFFLTWGVWTIIMYEISGLVFDDLEWRDADDVGPLRSNSKAFTRSLFGFLGLDRFYLGYKRMGVVKLLTLGLLGFWWILDLFFIAKRAVPDAAGRSTT